MSYACLTTRVRGFVLVNFSLCARRSPTVGGLICCDQGLRVRPGGAGKSSVSCRVLGFAQPTAPRLRSRCALGLVARRFHALVQFHSTCLSHADLRNPEALTCVCTLRLLISFSISIVLSRCIETLVTYCLRLSQNSVLHKTRTSSKEFRISHPRNVHKGQ
ncbi:hypothetical protein PENSPDRAFT_310491 [Peniophora sp. CONT]|nr:hypothetical protein PENSPDRAFT_310491 [Peniophora sp. CONT]